jgi:hypothetical protein
LSYVTTDDRGNSIHTNSQSMYILSQLLRVTIRARRSTNQQREKIDKKEKHLSNHSQRQNSAVTYSRHSICPVNFKKNVSGMITSGRRKKNDRQYKTMFSVST